MAPRGCPVAAASKEAGQPEQVAEVVPGSVVVHLVDVQIALEEGDNEDKGGDEPLPDPAPEPCHPAVLARQCPWRWLGPGAHAAKNVISRRTNTRAAAERVMAASVEDSLKFELLELRANDDPTREKVSLGRQQLTPLPRARKEPVGYQRNQKGPRPLSPAPETLPRRLRALRRAADDPGAGVQAQPAGRNRAAEN